MQSYIGKSPLSIHRLQIETPILPNRLVGDTHKYTFRCEFMFEFFTGSLPRNGLHRQSSPRHLYRYLVQNRDVGWDKGEILPVCQWPAMLPYGGALYLDWQLHHSIQLQHTLADLAVCIHCVLCMPLPPYSDGEVAQLQRQPCHKNRYKLPYAHLLNYPTRSSQPYRLAIPWRGGRYIQCLQPSLRKLFAHCQSDIE